MTESIDDRDLAILEILEQHGDYTVRQISKKTALAPTTVFARIKKLKKLGVIRKYTIDIDKKKIGLNLGAYILISADLQLLKTRHKTQHDLSEEIKKLSGVEKVHIITGGADMIARVHVRDMEEFDKLLLTKLQLLEGVSKTQTMMIMH